jgi:pantoate--beta-alanine ligase
MIDVVSELSALRERVRHWKREGLRVALVPTMGNLHAGHHSLVALARREADRVVASVFVNPTQFGPNEDFGRYPRTPDADAQGLAQAGCDLMWAPSVETMYPFGVDGTVRMSVPGVTSVLEGAHRPGHFDGVATVVARLFHQVEPDVAVFGRKDYQQLAVIRYMVQELAFPVRVVAAPTLREPDGLAMSSRNQYLGAQERPIAAQIHRTLQAMHQALASGAPVAEVEAQATRHLTEEGFEVDYAAVRTPELNAPTGDTGPRVALIAARLGRTRLIDNLEFEL